MKPLAPAKPAAPAKASRPARVKVRPPLSAFEADVADPLEGMTAAPDDVEAQGKEALKAITAGYREAEKRQRANVKEANSLGYYRVLVFETEAQADAFAEAVGADTKDTYIDGRDVADRFGISIPETEWKPKKVRVDQSLAKLAMPLKPGR